MTQQEAFNTIKKVVDLSLQNGVIKTIEESKIVFDSLQTLFKGVEELQTLFKGVEESEKNSLVDTKK